MEIKFANSDDEIISCFEVLSELRPHLKKETFVDTINNLKNNYGFELVFLKDSQIRSVAGFRISEWLYTGKYLEVEDLVTLEGSRSKGFGGKLFDWIVRYAHESNCRQVRLVSGVARKEAHHFYESKGMFFEAKYFSINV